jgi:site-specific DNA recombinase
VTTVAAILANPRYTGRQVWNRQHTDHEPVNGQSELFREHELQRLTPSSQWRSRGGSSIRRW